MLSLNQMIDPSETCTQCGDRYDGHDLYFDPMWLEALYDTITMPRCMDFRLRTDPEDVKGG